MLSEGHRSEACQQITAGRGRDEGYCTILIFDFIGLIASCRKRDANVKRSSMDPWFVAES
jgi:hypothetical protein